MPVAEKIAALFEILTAADVAAMPPAARRRFAAACRHWAEQAEPRAEPAKAGVLADLRGNPRQA
jgi:hypothetical protein